MSNHPPIPQVGSGFSSLNQRKPRWDDKVPWFDIPKDGQWHQLRFIGNIYMTACHWLETKTGKRFPLMCPNYDSATQSFNGGPNPIMDEFDPKNSQIKKIKDLSPRQSGFIHAIVRSVQMQGSSDPKWRPWRPVRVPMSVIIQIKNLTQLNTHLIEGKTYVADVTDPYYGKDVLIMYDPGSSNPNQKYTITFGNHTPLNPVEMNYLQELFDWNKIIEYPTLADMKQSLQVNGYYQLLNGGAAPGMPGVQDQVMQNVPPPPSYQMATINPAAPTAAPVMQPPGFGQAPAYPQQAPVYPQQAAPAPQPVMPQQPVFPQQPPQVAQPVYPTAPQPVYPTAPAPQPMVAPAPVPQQFAPPPVQNVVPNFTPQVGVPPLGESNAAPAGAVVSTATAAAVAVQPQVQVAQPQPQLHLVPPVQAAVPADRRFQFPGKPEGLTGTEFQVVVSKFAEALPRANPLKTWDNGDAAGLQVLNCYGSYKGDPHCIRCPLRRYCLQY